MTIEAEHIFKSFGEKNVLSDISMSIAEGDSIVITGPSGSGKTTFLRILLNLEKPDRGKVTLLGDYKYAGLNAGVVFQEDRLCESFCAVENVAMVGKKITRARARAELEEILPKECLDQPVKELSGGMKRRVAIVRAMCVPADVFIMDEPFTGLDDENRAIAIEYILKNKSSSPLIITAHDIEGLDFCKKMVLK